jgi:hypothetical protein
MRMSAQVEYVGLDKRKFSPKLINSWARRASAVLISFVPELVLVDE